MDDLESLAAAIDRASTVVALTGAGISAPSGVPTFRGDDGVWQHFDEGQFTAGRFRRDPAGFWDDRVDLQRELFGADSEPNAAHEALAELAAEGVLEAVVTQNTDDLHREAATQVQDRAADEKSNPASGPAVDDHEILELHGNARRVRCVDCERRQDAGPIFERAADGELPPRCDCGGVFKPDVVLFGEQLSGAVVQRARTLASESDVFLAIGSSLVVQPAASLPRQAAADGTLAVINLEETPCDGDAAVVCRADVTEAVPQLRELVRA